MDVSQYLEIFLDESREHIQNLNTQIMDLEQNPESENTINEIFRTIPRLAPHSWLPCQRELDCDKAISYYKLQHSAISSTLIFAQPYLSQD